MMALTAISIHALLAESDQRVTTIVFSDKKFLSTLSLRRATHQNLKSSARRQKFLSTLSLRRATPAYHGRAAELDYFYPRSPCGERRGTGGADADTWWISIHALLAESDQLMRYTPSCTPRFLSTLSLRRATHADRIRPDLCSISIHALLAESDGGLVPSAAPLLRFLSTLSLRRATAGI